MKPPPGEFEREMPLFSNVINLVNRREGVVNDWSHLTSANGIHYSAAESIGKRRRDRGVREPAADEAGRDAEIWKFEALGEIGNVSCLRLDALEFAGLQGP